MRDEIKGWLFVTVQFGLFAAIVLTPIEQDWKWPTYLGIVSWVAFGISGVALWQLGKARTATPVPTAEGKLIVTGLYRRVRHPIYGLLILGFGLMSLATQNWQAIYFWVSLIFLFYFKSNFEEKLLARRYSDYDNYRKQTGRFFPKF